MDEVFVVSHWTNIGFGMGRVNGLHACPASATAVHTLEGAASAHEALRLCVLNVTATFNKSHQLLFIIWDCLPTAS